MSSEINFIIDLMRQKQSYAKLLFYSMPKPVKKSIHSIIRQINKQIRDLKNKLTS